VSYPAGSGTEPQLAIYDCNCLYCLARPRDDCVSPRATCVILALIVAFESSVSLT